MAGQEFCKEKHKLYLLQFNLYSMYFQYSSDISYIMLYPINIIKSRFKKEIYFVSRINFIYEIHNSLIL